MVAADHAGRRDLHGRAVPSGLSGYAADHANLWIINEVAAWSPPTMQVV